MAQNIFTPLGIATALAYPIVSSVEHSILGPLSELMSQDSWSDTPVALPSVNDIIRANMAGFIGDEWAHRACFAQGARYWGNKKPEDDRAYSWLWRQVAISGLTRPGPATAMELWARGLLNSADTQDYLHRAGAETFAWWNVRKLWESVPGEELIMSMWRKGFLTRNEAFDLLVRSGADTKLWMDTFNAGLEYPGASQAMQAWMHGRIPEEVKNVIIGRNGVHDDTWLRMQDAWATYPGVNEALRGLVRDRVSEDFARKCVAKAGGKWEDFVQLLPSIKEVPLPQMALQALVRNRVTQEYAQAIIKKSGGDWETWSALLPSMATVISIADTLELRNRGIIDDERVEEYLKRNGVTEGNDILLMRKLRHRIPSPAELVVMGTRLAFDAETATFLGLYNDQPEMMREWLEMAGVDLPLGINIGADGVQREATTADLYWAAARQGMTLAEAIAAYRRLRPEEIANIRRFVPDAEPFDRAQLRGWMKWNGIPTGQQAALEELGYLPLSLREIRTVVRLGTRPKEWVVARLQDQGHRQDRAEDLYDILVDQEKWRQEAPLRAIQNSLLNKVAQEVMEQYSVGTVDKQTARDYLINARVNSEVVDQMLNVIDAKLASKMAQEGIRAVRRDYLNGTLNAVEVSQQLSAMGIVEQRVRDYVALWTVQRSRVRRTATTAQILDWVGKGILDATTAQVRLENLGWDRPDIIVQLQVAEGKLLQQEARAVSAEDKRRLARAKELDRIQKENDRMKRQLQADQRRATPRATLDKWLCSGAISEGFYLARMQAMGFDAATSEEYLSVARAKKACQPAQEGTPFPHVPPEQGNGEPVK